MSGFFDDSHVTDIGLEGSLGPQVSSFEMIRQGYRQQFHIDSALALNNELQSRWLESLRAAQISNGRAASYDESWAYLAMAQHIKGRPIEINESPSLDVLTPGLGPISAGRTLSTYLVEPDRAARIKNVIEANEAIKKLNNPDIKSFEQIFEEVSQMQRELEGETSSMYARTNTTGVLGNLLGAIGGSFTTRDPLNIVTAPIGAGRTILARIGTDMAIAAGVVTATEFGMVHPNRELAGLRERNPLFNIIAATLGAGVIRGGLEGIGAGVRTFRDRAASRASDDLDLNDSQLAQMFDSSSTNPSIRAGARALDDADFIERNNPFGDGPAAQERFLAELRQVQRAMDAEPMTAVARVMPEMPFKYLEKQGDFQFVKEQAPELYARMEVAQAKVTAATQQIAEITSKPKPDLIDSVRLVDIDAAEKLAQLSARVDDLTLPEPVRIAANIEIQAVIRNLGPDKIKQAVVEAEQISNVTVKDLRAVKRSANKEYRTAYRAVEVEAERLRAKRDAIEAEQQRQGFNILADPGRSFNWTTLRHDNVAARVDAINAASETLDEAAAARFARQTTDEEAVAREAWQTDEGIDIGLRQPVDPEFRIITDEGEITVAQAMRDLQDDADLDVAMRTCLL